MVAIEVIQGIMYFLMGFLISASIPFFFFYLVVYAKRHRFSWKIVLGFLLRLSLIPVVFILLMGIVGLLVLGVDAESVNLTPFNLWLIGGGGAFGIIAGGAVFISGLISAIRSMRRRTEVVDKPTLSTTLK